MNEHGLLIVTGIPVLTLGALLVWSWRRISLLGTLIVGATLVHEIVLVSFPVWYSVFTDFELEGSMNALVGADDLLRVMTGESIFVMMFAFAFIVGWPRLRLQTGLAIRTAFCQNQIRRSRLVLNLLIVMGILVYIKRISPISTLPGGTGWSLEQLFLSLIQAFFWFTSLAACALVLTRRRALFTNPVQALLAGIPMLALVMVGLSTGLRGRIMWVISLLIVTGILNHQTKFVALGVVIAILMIPLFAFFGSAYRFIDKDDMMTGPARIEMFSLLYQEGRDRVVEETKNMADDFLYGLALRAQGPRNMVVLYRQYDNARGAGFNTYIGALFFPIPRLVWPEKPVAGGTDDTSLSSAMYKSMELSYGDQGTMGPILASAHAYWEGGWGWLVAAGFITGLIWNKIIKLCRRIPEDIAAVVTLAFAAALLNDGMLTMLTPLYAIIIAGWQSVLPVLIIYRSTVLFFAKRSIIASESIP